MSLQEFLEQMEDHVDQLCRRGALDNKKIVLFGASVNEGRCKRWLEDRGFAVDAIVDNSREKTGQEYLGLMVRTPEEVLLPYDEERVVLIASVTYWSEMTQQVVQMGYSKKTQVFTVGAGGETKPRRVFVPRVLQAIRGGRALRKLTRDAGGARSVFIAPQSSAGDVYVECLFVREFVRRNKLPPPLIVVPNGSCRGMAELCGFDEIAVVGENVLWQIADYVRFMRRGPEHMVPMYYLMLNGAVGGLQGFKGLNFERMFRYAAFGLDDGVPHDVPGPGDPAQARAALAENGLEPGRTVILAPYARTLVHGHNAPFWDALAREFDRRGYSVCTSGFGPEEPAVAGTPLVQFSFPEAIQFVEAAGFFVGLRSGQCDAISSAKALKVILHERGPWIKTSLFGMFSLNAMGLCDDAIEFEFASAEMDAILGDVLRAIP